MYRYSTVYTLVPTQLGLPLSSDPAAAADGRVGLHDDAVLLARLEDVLVAAVRVELDLVQDGLHLASEKDSKCDHITIAPKMIICLISKS